MKKYFLLLLVVCTFEQNFSNSLVDNPEKSLQQFESHQNYPADTNYINLLLNISKNIRYTDPDSSLVSAQKALQLSDNNNFNKSKTLSLQIIADIYCDLGRHMEAEKLLEEALAIAENINSHSAICSIYNTLSRVYIFTGDKFKAMDYTRKAMDYAPKLGVEEGERLTIICLFNMAYMHMQSGDQSSALNSYFEILSRVTKSGDSERIPMILNNIAMIYVEKGDYDLALEKISEAFAENEKMDAPVELATLFVTEGYIYLKLKKYQEAETSFGKALDLARKHDSLNHMSLIYAYLGDIYSEQGMYPEAIASVSESILLSEKIANGERIARSYVSLSRIYLHQKQFDKAVSAAEKALQICGEMYIYLQKDVHELLSKIYETQNRGMLALKHHKLFKELSDSQFTGNMEKQVINLEARYKYEKRELELRADQTLKEAEFHKQKTRMEWILISALAILVSAIIFLSLIVNSRRKLQMAYKKLENANNEISEQQDKIQKQSEKLHHTNEKLIDLIKFKQDILGMIVHDLKNPLSAILFFTKDIPDTKTLDLLHESAQRMLRLVMNILDINKYEDSKLELNYSENDLSELVKEAIKSSEINAKQKNISFVSDLQAGLNSGFDNELISRTLDNIISNAIKFSPTQERITIRTEKSNDRLYVRISNNGPAIPPEMQELIFEPYGRADTKENGDAVQSTGLGLTFCKIAVTAHGGEIGVNSSEGNPTEFWFWIP